MESSDGEVKLELDETKVDDIMNEGDLADNTFVEEEPREEVNDPLNIHSESHTLGLNQRRRNYVHDGYKDPAMKKWEGELSEMIYKNGKNLFCKLCDYKHHRRGYALNHVETNHPPKNFPCYKCLKCGDVFASRHTFQHIYQGCMQMIHQ
jgi:hypothetical protein